MGYVKLLGVCLVGFATIAASGLVQAQEKFSGMVVNKLMEPQTQKFDSGTTILLVGNRGVVMTDDPKHPQNGAKSACNGSVALAKDGKPMGGKGSCSYTDKEGDLFWLTWDASGTWAYNGGTGKFDSLSGSGTYKTVSSGNGVEAVSFEGTYKLK